MVDSLWWYGGVAGGIAITWIGNILSLQKNILVSFLGRFIAIGAWLYTITLVVLFFLFYFGY